MTPASFIARAIISSHVLLGVMFRDIKLCPENIDTMTRPPSKTTSPPE